MNDLIFHLWSDIKGNELLLLLFFFFFLLNCQRLNNEMVLAEVQSDRHFHMLLSGNISWYSPSGNYFGNI